ncbi:hypothetical protein BHE74_00055295 [Ensete ventricosum]|nr:hypothetical protein BHE74_00055295 [Ensete ventricosum]RZS25399.1 hypothetical protein BHM03_00058592 [Ensete ventricosum]
MGRFTKMIVQKMKDEKLFAPQGGPIILAQIISGTQQGNCNPKPQEAGDGLGVTKLSIPKSFDWISYLKDHSDYFKHLNPMSDIANVGLTGENLGVFDEQRGNAVKWEEAQSDTAVTWYKRYFDAPSGNDPVALNLSSMGKGQVWINGESIGRFWVSYLSPLGKASQSM